MKLSFRSRVNLGVALALAVLVLVGLVSYRGTVDLIETTYLLAHTHQVLGNLESLLGAAVGSETSVRGYVISGDETFLERHAAARLETSRILATLKLLTADNPLQQRRLAALEPRLISVLDSFDRTIQLRREAGPAPAIERVRVGEGKQRMDAVRALVHEMEQEERGLLTRRSRAASATASRTLAVILGGTVVALTLLVSGSVLVNREIRWRQEAEQRIRQSAARYHNLFDRVPVGLYRSTPDGQLLDVNAAMVQMLGYPDAASLTAAGAVALYVDPADRRRHLVDQLARGGVLRDLEVQWRRLDGSTIWVRHNLRAVREPGAVDFIYEGAVEDITESRKVQDALAVRTRALEAAQEELARKERLAILGQLAGGVSHELRNPLGVIRNSAYFLRMVVPGDERVRKHLQILEREVATASRIVTDLLDFARVAPPVRVSVDLNELARELLERNPPPEQVLLTLDLAKDLPAVVVDRDQVELVLANFLRNAVQAMPDGGMLTIRTTATEDGVRIVVEDTGVGIAPEHRELIFEPLFTTRARGIGLGLAVARSLAEANEGRITVTSQPGRGSQFALAFAQAPESR
jgi:PAS domain S-box-containing protein